MEKEIEPIIKRYCGAIEERVAACYDKKVAQLLKTQICREVRQNCNNKAIVAFVREYVDALIRQRFQKRSS